MNKDEPLDIDFGDDEGAPKKTIETSVLDLSVEVKKKKTKPTLIVIRHGNTFEAGEAPRRIGARTDLPLTNEGRAQLVKLKDYLEKANMKPQRVYSGPLQRTMQSASLLSPSYEILEFLREIYHGMDENKTEDVVLKRIGQVALDNWEKKNQLPPGWSADILSIRQGWSGLKKLVRDSGETWAAVTSGGIARFVFDGVENVPENKKLSTGAFGVFVYDHDRQTWVCRGWNIRP